MVSLQRNARLRPKSSVQSATGIKGPNVVQKSRGFTAGAFHLREFFHGQTADTIKRVRWTFLVGAFGVPFVLMLISISAQSVALFCLTAVTQYLGLVAERWFFFAEARHPQNIYYARAS